MNSESTTMSPNVATKALAILSLGTFWLIPYSPLITIAALVRTKHSTGWPRRLVVAAAVLCSIYNLALATWICLLTIHVLAGGLQQ